MPSPRVAIEYQGRKPVIPSGTTHYAQSLLPSFVPNNANLGEQKILGNEAITITATVPATAAAGAAQIFANQGFTVFPNLKLAPTDGARIVFVNVSVPQYSGALFGAPTLVLGCAQGALQSGELLASTNYTGFYVASAIVMYALAAVSAGTLKITLQALLIGSVTS